MRTPNIDIYIELYTDIHVNLCLCARICPCVLLTIANVNVFLPFPTVIVGIVFFCLGFYILWQRGEAAAPFRAPVGDFSN